MIDYSDGIGQTIRKRRKGLRLSQRQVADLAGKTQSQIARLEAGVDDPRFSTVVQVARSLSTEIVLVPIRLLPAVLDLLHQHGSGSNAKSTVRLVGNAPEDADSEESNES